MLTALSHLVFRLRRPAAVALLLLCGFVDEREATAATQPSQADVEEVYVFDFGKFIRWPAGSDEGPISICVAGSSSFSEGLEKIVANENIRGRSLEVRRVEHAADESGCAILFIDTTQRARADELLRAVVDRPTLTVSDIPDFLSRGGMIQFQLVEKRVRFSVNLNAVNRCHLAMSSELLKVAVSVNGRMPEGGAQ